jgi:N-acyl-D-aspartate/D-glutamate deacylase
MGERGAANEPATADDIARMAEIVQAGVAAGAVGLSVNRLELHKSKDGREVPGTFAEIDEILALAHAVAAGSPDAVFSTIFSLGAQADDAVWHEQIDWVARLSRETGLAVTFPFGASSDGSDRWRARLARIEAENANGARLYPQVGSHRQGLLCGLRTMNPFMGRPSYTALAGLPPAERATRMADPAVKAAILAEHGAPGTTALASLMLSQATAVFPPAPMPEQEPDPATSLAAQAAATGRDPQDLLYDWTIADEGQALVHFFLGGYAGSLDPSLELMAHPDSVLGLGDGGAHVDVICDCGYPSFLLSYWVRERTRGTLGFETAIKILTSEPAALYGLHDRGVVAPGYKADLNVLDPDRVSPRPVEIVDDLPTGAIRIVQRTDGFVATLVDGVVVQRDGEDTGARPGRVVRSRPRGA